MPWDLAIQLKSFCAIGLRWMLAPKTYITNSNPNLHVQVGSIGMQQVTQSSKEVCVHVAGSGAWAC